MSAQLPIRFGRAAAAAAIILSVLLASACTSDGDDDPTRTATPTPTAEPTASPFPPVPTATTTPTASPALPPSLEVSATSTWQRRELAMGDEVPDVLGAFLFDPESGRGTLWSLAPGVISDPLLELVSTTPGGNHVVAASHVVNTADGHSFSWGSRAALLQTDDRGLALFKAKDQCTFWVTDLSGAQLAAIAGFELQAERHCNVEARFAPDGSQLLATVQGNGSDGGAALHLVDLHSAEVTEVARVQPTRLRFVDRSPDDVAMLTASLPGESWLGTYVWSERTFTTRLLETGEPLSASDKGPPNPRRVTPSPDGRWLAWAETADLSVGLGLGGVDEWPVTVIASVEGDRPPVVAHRVALTNGLITPGWLPDSSGIVVQSEDGFAVLRTDGAWQPLAFPMAEHFDPVPLPAPDDSDRFAYDGRIVSADGEVLGTVPAVADLWGRATDDRPSNWDGRTRYTWSADGDHLILIRTEIPGSDYGRGGVAAIGLPARIVVGDRTPGTTIELRVAADGDRLNARSAPGLDTARIGQFEDGAILTIARDRNIDHCGQNGCSILNDPDLDYDEGWWIYVSGSGTDGDLTGWVSSEFLAWPD